MFARLLIGLCAVVATASTHSAAAAPSSPSIAALPAAAPGSGAWHFEVESNWAKVPAGTALGPTHGGVVIDKAGLVYMTTDAPAGILVFKPDGTLARTIAPEFSGIHGLTLREENGREFLYAAHLKGQQVVKLDLDGNLQWAIGTPAESGLYNEKVQFKPTAVAVAPDGRIYVADGYGASVVHEYSADRKWLRVIGRKGSADGEFQTCHGMALDLRYDRPLLLICDRENRRLVHFDLDGNFVRTLTTGLRRPSSIAMRGEFAAIVELEGRVIITDKAGRIVATLGDNPDPKQWAAFKLPPEQWRDGIFIAPHGAAFDAAGNLFVQDWNYLGRLTKLRFVPGSTASAR
jgi:hypothetical protein